MKLPKFILRLSLKFSFLAALTLIAVEIFKYYGVVLNWTGISVWLFVSLMVVFHLLIRLTTKTSLGEAFAFNLLSFAFPWSMLLTFMMVGAESFQKGRENFFFAELSLDYRGLALLALTFLLFGLVHSSRQLWRAHYQQLNISLIGGLASAAFYLFLQAPEVYKQFTSEDHLVEYLTAFAFFSSGLLTLQLRPLLAKALPKNWLSQSLQFLSLLAALAFFLVSMEEISWGQRLLGLSTPEEVAAINRQGEINLHNLEGVWNFVYPTYLLIGLYGATAWFWRWLASDLLSFIKNKAVKIWLDLLVPKSFLVLNFSFIVIYVLLREKYGPWRYVAMEELSELLLVLGIMLHLLENKRQLKK